MAFGTPVTVLCAMAWPATSTADTKAAQAIPAAKRPLGIVEWNSVIGSLGAGGFDGGARFRGAGGRRRLRRRGVGGRRHLVDVHHNMAVEADDFTATQNLHRVGGYFSV